MCKRNNSDLYFTCSLIEQIGRTLHTKRGDVVTGLGEEGVRGIYKSADVLHCEPIAKIAEESIDIYSLTGADFDNVASSRYSVPSVWTMGKVYARLIEDVSEEDNVVETLINVYRSWIDDELSNYNSAFYFQPRDYVAECYRQGCVL